MRLGQRKATFPTPMRKTMMPAKSGKAGIHGTAEVPTTIKTTRIAGMTIFLMGLESAELP